MNEMKFIEGEWISIRYGKNVLIFEVREDEEGEPRRHKVKKTTGEVSPKGITIRSTDKFKRVKKNKRTGKMKAKIKVEKEVNFTHLKVKAGARYWEDATVNGIEDIEGNLIPFRDGDYWCPTIDLETGIIKDWPQGKTAEVHYKVCDDGEYWLVADDGFELKYPGDYVPNILDIDGESYGDYIILNIDENGQIADWPKKHDIRGFLREEAKNV
ncbi:hypothetical protein [Algoriphagus sp.]|jgi:hypothetical protein|uniref:hypothetical protein n=2 Tax=Algoriphagus sp. TaxID=1872435 RepID=UPI00257FEACD|nr:hypothetical protein [Algoriphagus sp.]|tara:strand:- start:6815 stop:7453 length:639 start_codon:yes stop_codon:yes gene_type:complete